MELNRICEVTDVFQLSPLFFSFFCFFFSAIVYYDYSQMNILVSKLFEYLKRVLSVHCHDVLVELVHAEFYRLTS